MSDYRGVGTVCVGWGSEFLGVGWWCVGVWVFVGAMRVVLCAACFFACSGTMFSPRFCCGGQWGLLWYLCEMRGGWWRTGGYSG